VVTGQHGSVYVSSKWRPRPNFELPVGHRLADTDVGHWTVRFSRMPWLVGLTDVGRSSMAHFNARHITPLSSVVLRFHGIGSWEAQDGESSVRPA
jgi:hypothetical protein